MIIITNNINELRKQIIKIKKSNKEEIIVVKAQDDEFNRKVLEQNDIDILLAPESHSRKDYLKQRDSGLNEYLCRLAKKNNIKIALDIDNLKKLEKKEKARVLARIRQNIFLAKKTGANIIVFNQDKYNILDIQSFFKTLKASTKQVK
jgi:RNase P/RNase MRP subunit p30